MDKGKFIGILILTVSCADVGHARKLFNLRPGKLYTRLDLYGECPYNRKENMEIENMTSTKYGAHDYGMNGILHVHHSVDIAKCVAKIRRCPSTVNTSCEHFQTWTFGRETCPVATDSKMPWFGFFHMLPRLHCPIQKGDYILQNGTFGVEKLGNLPIALEDYYLRSTLEVFDSKDFFCCFETAGAVFRSRS